MRLISQCKTFQRNLRVTNPVRQSRVSTDTDSESGGRTITFGAGGSYTDSETTSQSYTISDSTSIAIGANGTIAAGTAVSLTTQTYADSQSFMEYGSENIPDPEGGPPFGGELTQSSVTTSDAFSTDQGTQTLGALGAISGGGNSFHFNQGDYNSLSLNTPETDTASYSLTLSGTETYAAGGAISGGWDSFTWDQNAYDQATLSDSQSTTTSSPSSETNYSMILHDTVSDTMYDVGSDVLGASDSIVSDGDSYTIIDSRQLTSTVVDAGSSATPYEVEGTGSDNDVMTDSGTSTLSASGQTFGTDTVTYNESSNDNALDTESFGAYSYVWGSASDTYSDSDVSTITDSNGVTTSGGRKRGTWRKSTVILSAMSPFFPL